MNARINQFFHVSYRKCVAFVGIHVNNLISVVTVYAKIFLDFLFRQIELLHEIVHKVEFHQTFLA